MEENKVIIQIKLFIMFLFLIFRNICGRYDYSIYILQKYCGVEASDKA